MAKSGGRPRDGSELPVGVDMTDLAALDAHVIMQEEYDDIPELTDEWFARATPRVGGVPVRRGRPKAEATKTAVNIRLSPEVIAHFKAGGPGWQTRIDEALKAHVAAAGATPR